MQKFTEQDTRRMLCNSPDIKTREMAKRASTVAALTKVLTATLEAGNSKAELATFLTKKTLGFSELAAVDSNSKALKSVNFVANMTLATIGLKTLANATSPLKAGVTITFVTAEKIVMAAGYAEFDRCKVAIASMATTVGLSALGCTATVGLGCAAGVLATASAAYDVHASCSAEK